MGRNRKHTGKKQHFCTNGYPETIIWRESYRISDQKKLLTKLPKERGCTHFVDFLGDYNYEGTTSELILPRGT